MFSNWRAYERSVSVVELTPACPNTTAPNAITASESRIKVSQRVNELASGSVNVVKLTPACDICHVEMLTGDTTALGFYGV